MRHLFFDTETAGFNGPVLQLGYVIERDGSTETKSAYFCHARPYEIHPKAYEVHGIKKEFLEAFGVPSPQIPIHLLEFREELIKPNTVIVAHNKSFDIRMMQAEFYEYGIEWPDVVVTCTMAAAKAAFDCGSLDWLHSHLFNELVRGAHDALKDAQITARCFFELKRLGLL